MTTVGAGGGGTPLKSRALTSASASLVSTPAKTPTPVSLKQKLLGKKFTLDKDIFTLGSLDLEPANKDITLTDKHSISQTGKRFLITVQTKPKKSQSGYYTLDDEAKRRNSTRRRRSDKKRRSTRRRK
jgi:hypothetical protein